MLTKSQADIKELRGECGIVEVPLGLATKLYIAPQAVATIVATSAAEEGGLQLNVGEGAGVHLVLPELPLHGNVVVEVGAGAQFTLSVVAKVEHKHVFESLVRLTGEGSRAHAQVAVVGTGDSETELSLSLEHVAKSTFGRMVVRRVQSGNSFSTLRGMLKVAAGAHGTDTYLSDKALLLGEKARAESNPGLEILADDVRASHGATVGQLSPDELFYVRSRGLTETLAQELLVQAFLSSALVGVPPEHHVHAYVAK